MTADNNTCHRIKKFCWRSNPKSPGLLFWVFYFRRTEFSTSVMMLHWNKLVLCCVHSSNILLDEHLQPKLSDFGLARLRPHSVDQSCTIVMDTASHSNLGYLPEEYIRDGKLSVKLDVYSLGMVSAASCLTYYIPETGIICTNKDYVCILMLIIQLQETFVYFFIVLHLLLACHDWPNIIEHFSLHFF